MWVRFLSAFLILCTGAALAASIPVRPIRVAVISDLNGNYGDLTYDSEVSSAVKEVIRRQPDVVLSTGDMVAGQSKKLNGAQFKKMWDQFDRVVTAPFRKAGILFAPTPGNHDASGYPGYERERAQYRSFWKPKISRLNSVWPAHVDADFPFRYAFTVAGRALFVSLDATQVKPLSAAQKRWLFDILDRYRDYPIKVLFGHVPLYPFAQDGRENDYLHDATFESELNARGVSLFLSGHHHAYFPGRRGNLKLVSTSCLGGGQRRLLTSANFGNQEPSPKSVIWMEIGETTITSIEALEAPTFRTVIDRKSLPEWVGWPEMRIDRSDIVNTQRKGRKPWARH